MEITSDFMNAIAKFQSDCPRLKFDTTVKTGRYTYSYTSLGKIIETAGPHLKACGLSVMQFPGKIITLSEDVYAVELETMVMGHGSMINRISHMLIPSRGDYTPQDVGSAISYMRRYSHAAALGLVSEDDNDGHSVGEIYTNSASDKLWLRDVLDGLGITEKKNQKEIAEKMTETKSTKEVEVVKKLIN